MKQINLFLHRLLPICLLLAASFAAQASGGEAVPDTTRSGWGVYQERAASPDRLLEGRVAGLKVSATDGNPMGAVVSTIRGANSLRGGSQPLWIVDGVMLNPTALEVEPMLWNMPDVDYTAVQNTLAAINPMDVQSIEVLKDLSATAIYGSRGANGVIIVRTKRPSEEKFRITFATNASLVTPVKKNYGMLDIDSYKSYQLERPDGNTGLPYTTTTDWQDEAFQNAWATSQQLSLAWNEGKYQYYISAFYRNLQGVVEGNNSDLAGARFNFHADATKALSFGARIAFVYSGVNATKGTNLYPYSSTMTSILRGIPSQEQTVDTYAGWKADYDDFSSEYRVMPNIYFNFRPARGLKVDLNFGADYRGKDRSMWMGDGTPLGAAFNGVASLSTLTALQYNASATVSYDWTCYRHELHLQAGVEAFGGRDKWNTMNGYDFFSHDLRAKSITLAASAAQVHRYVEPYSTLAGAAAVSYTYGGRYSISGSVRADKFSRFEDQFEIYPAGEISWNIKNERALQDSRTLSALKISAGFGKAGFTSSAPFAVTGRYVGMGGEYPSVDPTVQVFYSDFMKLVSTEYNARLELGFMDQRLRLEAGVYQKETDDRMSVFLRGEEKGTHGIWFYAPRSLDWQTISSLRNRGVEVTLSADIVRRKDLTFTLSANGAFNSNEVTKADQANRFGQGVGFAQAANANIVGQPVSALWGLQAVGLITEANIATAPTFYGQPARLGDVLYRNLTSGDSDINDDDFTVIGNPWSKFNGGLQAVLTYKRFTLGVDLTANLGGEILNLDRMAREYTDGDWNITREAYARAYRGDAWQTRPAIGASNTAVVSDRYVESGDFVRISDISLSYRIPVDKIKWIGSLGVNLDLRNMFVFSGYKGWDPEVNSFGVDNARPGIDYGSMVGSRSFSLGVNITF